jgi:hypothetical protein
MSNKTSLSLTVLILTSFSCVISSVQLSDIHTVAGWWKLRKPFNPLLIIDPLLVSHHILKDKPTSQNNSVFSPFEALTTGLPGSRDRGLPCPVYDQKRFSR